MQDSFFQIESGKPIPYTPFWTKVNEPTSFQVIFSQRQDFEGKSSIIKYDYRLTLKNYTVQEEELYYSPLGRYRKAYSRQGQKIRVGNTIKSIPESFEENLRDNCSLISFASQLSSQTVAQQCKRYKFYSNVNHAGLQGFKFDPRILVELSRKSDQSRILNAVRLADLGISELNVDSLSVSEKTIEPQELEDFITNPEIPNSVRATLKKIKQLQVKEEEFDIYFSHEIDGKIIRSYPDQESSGTRQFLTLLYYVINALEEGIVLIIDELEIKLHQNLVAYLIGLFENKYENDNKSQLICSFHNSFLIKCLKPEQLWFTEKDDKGKTDVFCAIDFQEIEQEKADLESFYRLGKFGAKPRGL